MFNEHITSPLASVFIGLGSNIEPRLDYLKAAIKELRMLGTIAGISSVYETAPVGGVPQHDYLNAVIELHTPLGPLELITRLKALEKSIGRKDRPRWHEREIDLDLLFYSDLILDSALLTLPHPEIPHRAFVLAPLCEIAPYFQHPFLKKSVSELLRNVDATSMRITTLSF
jgi:2-amino-4-hydroxy-6-hydroxymethyldihydropteridine diphosphokinase